jgi:hypothetical protein
MQSLNPNVSGDRKRNITTGNATLGGTDIRNVRLLPSLLPGKIIHALR